MKLRKIKKLLFSTHRIKTAFIALFFIFTFYAPKNGCCQQYSFIYENTPVSKALSEVAKAMNIRIAFDAGELKKYTVTKTVSGSAAVIIESLIENTGHTVDFRHDTYLIRKSTPGRKAGRHRERLYSGIVFDKETGERLPYTNIFLWEKGISVSANVDGTFSIKLQDSSSTFIQVKYLGYYTLDTILRPTSPDMFLRFGLMKKTQAIPTVEVTGEKLEMVDFSEETGHFTFNPARFSDLPNYGETDVFRALQLLPGISSVENSSQLNIRGSSADQNLVLFDGFTLYNLDHFFGVFSALNPNVIKNIQVYRGGFDSRYGERVSGIVDITGKSGNMLRPRFYGGINLISANLTAEIPLSQKLTLLTAGRRAYSDVYSSWLANALLADKLGQAQRFPGQEANVLKPRFYFSDYNLKLTCNLNESENISLSLYGAKDNLNSSNISGDDNLSINTEDINKWGNYGFGVSWKKQWNGSYFSDLQIGHSGYFNDYSNETVFLDQSTFNPPPESQASMGEDITNETNDLTDYFITFRNRYFFNQLNQGDFGISVKYNQFRFYKDATRDFIYNNLKSSAFLYTLFLQDKVILYGRLAMKPGFRINLYGATGQLYFEPRFSASYAIGEGFTLKMATGRYVQFLNKSASEQTYGYNRDFWVLADNEGHPVVSSNHLIAGASYKLKNFFFDVEGYYRTVDGLQEYLFFQNPEQHGGQPSPGMAAPGLSRFISGNGKAAGIDFLAKYESTNFTSWLAYSLSKATCSYDEINEGGEIPANYDQTHEFKWTNIYSLKKWNFSTLMLFTTGHPYIEYTYKDEDFSTTRVYSRLPDYFRIDFSANYNFNIKSINIKPGFSLLNALNTENYLDIYTRRFDFENNQFNEISLVKAQELTLNFFVNFRF